MEFDQERSIAPLGSILYGTLTTLVVNLILTILFVVVTELGWLAIIKPFSNHLYLFIGYIAVIIGSIAAGRESVTRGWLTGLGVGITCSFIFLILNTFIGHPVAWGIFLAKMLINIFIGIFGGIIGVNLAGNKK